MNYEARLDEVSLERIKRSKILSQIYFVGKSKAPQILSKFSRLIHPLNKHKRDILAMRNYILDNSTTFALALGTMNDLPDVRDDLVLAHQGFKLLDFIDEKKGLESEEKDKLMAQYLETVRHPDPDFSNVRDLESKLNGLGFEERDEEHRSLIEHVDVLIRAFRDRYSKVRDTFLDYGAKMAEGFSKARKKTTIEEWGEVDRDCLFAAGYVGYLVNGIYEARKLITAEQAQELKTPARTVGKALQLGNNLRDLFKDMDEGIKHWPDKNIKAIKELDGIENQEEKRKEAMAVFNEEFRELVVYSQDKFFKAVEYTDNLPRGKFNGHILFPALSLACYAQVIRDIDNLSFLCTRGESYKKSPRELFDAKDVVAALVKEGSSIRPYLEHILDRRRPSREYRP